MESSKRTPAVLASTPNLIALALLLLAYSLPVMAQEDYSGFSWKDLNGQSHTLADYKGKVVVLNFWATWCVPCQHEGCERHRLSFSACLDALSTASVIEAARKLLEPVTVTAAASAPRS